MDGDCFKHLLSDSATGSATAIYRQPARASRNVGTKTSAINTSLPDVPIPSYRQFLYKYISYTFVNIPASKGFTHMKNNLFDLSDVTRTVLLAATGLFLLIDAPPLVGATLTFEGLTEGALVGSFYAGLGIDVSGATALVSRFSGGTGDFTGEPSPPTVAFSPDAIMINVSAGFVGPMAFSYTNPGGSTNMRAYSEINGAGLRLVDAFFGATIPSDDSAFPPFVAADLIWDGTARSVIIFSRGPGGFLLDDVSLQLAVPEPTSMTLLLSGFLSGAIFSAWQVFCKLPGKRLF